MDIKLRKNEALECELVELITENEENIEIVVQILKVFSNPEHLRIMFAIIYGEQTVQNYQYNTGIRQIILS